MDLNEILVFTRVVQAGSLTAAARGLGMPKSTVSRKLAELEDRLGARLLQRTTRKLHLTDAGRVYFERAARIIAEAEEADREVTQLQSAPTGPLRITTPLTFSLLGPLVADFLKRYPDVQLEIVCTDRRVDLVEEGFDVAIRAGELEDSGLRVRRLGGMRRLLVAAPEYLRQHGTPRAPADLAAHGCIVFGDTRSVHWKLQRKNRLFETTVKPRLVVNDYDLLRETILAGLGIAWLPENLCSADLEARRLIRVLPEWQSPETPLNALYASTRHLSAKVTAFLQAVEEGLPDSCRGAGSGPKRAEPPIADPGQPEASDPSGREERERTPHAPSPARRPGGKKDFTPARKSSRSPAISRPAAQARPGKGSGSA